jgi:hypothetical protein
MKNEMRGAVVENIKNDLRKVEVFNINFESARIERHTRGYNGRSYMKLATF